MSQRRRPARRGAPAHLVLDNEALGQISSGAPSRPLLVALQGTFSSGGRVVLPTCVVVERNHDQTTPGASGTNRILRDAHADPLTAARAAEAARLRGRCRDGGSVVDAHVAATALAVVRQFGGNAVVATSDPGDITGLLDAADDTAARAATVVHPL